MKLSFRSLIFLVLLTFLTLTVPAVAQFNASIQGTVEDPTGAVVPGANVTATNESTGVSKNAQSSGNGFYRIGELQPGSYTVKTEAQGFRPNTSSNVQVAAEQPRGLNVQLQTGGATQTVEVTETTPELQTENGSVEGQITSQQLLQLPSYGRDPYADLRLAPGVFGQGGISNGGGAVNLPNSTGPGGSSLGIFQTENQVPISANGQRLSSNSYMIDGVSVNSQTWGGAAVVTPNVDAVQEMNVTTSSYSALDSRNSGAIVKVVTKSGTNQFHGDGFFQYQDPNFNAFNKYGGPALGSTPVRVDNNWKQFGGAIGGPILKDKLFFFFSYEGLRSNNTTYSVPTYIESPQFRNALHTAFPGSFGDQIVNQPGIAPGVAQVYTPTCQLFTQASLPCQVVGNGLDIGSPTGGLGTYVPTLTGGGLDGIPDLQYVQIATPSTASPNQYNGRVDYHFGQQQFSASGFLTKGNLLESDSLARPADAIHFKPTNEALMLAWVSTITPTLLNEARFNVTRWAYNTVSGSGVNWALPGIDAEGFPAGNFRIQWGQPGNNVGTPAVFAENTYQASDTVTKIFGSHALRFGGQYNWEQNNDTPAGQARPQYAFTGLWNLFNSAPLFEGITANPLTNVPSTGHQNFRTHYYAAFVQDDWKVKPTLTLNLGLRYEFYSPLQDLQNQITNLFVPPDYNTGLLNASVHKLGEYYKPDRNNFAPRIGFAWSPSQYEGKVVFRGGFGISYDRVPETLLLNSRANPPYQANFGFCCGNASDPFNGGLIQLSTSSNSIYGYTLSPAVATKITFGPNNLPIGTGVEVWGTPQNFPNPYVYVYSLEMQNQLPSNFVFVMGYQGSDTHKETRILNQNFVYGAVNPSITNAYVIEPDINGNFNSLNLRLTRNFANNLQMAVNYRWSKSLDQLSYGGPGFVTNQTYPQNLKYEYGPSDFDARHFVTASAVYYLPGSHRKDWIGTVLGGFELSGIFTFNTGLPWTPVSSQYCLPVASQCLSPIRPSGVIAPIVYDNSNSALTTPGVNFPGGGLAYFNTHPGIPAIGRNSFRGPNYRGIDLSLSKNFRLDTLGLPEGTLIQLRANAYNIFNLLNLNSFNFGDANTNITDPTFGRAESAQAGRVIELQARIQF